MTASLNDSVFWCQCVCGCTGVFVCTRCGDCKRVAVVVAGVVLVSVGQVDDGGAEAGLLSPVSCGSDV